MAVEFDPCYKWLGILPKDQPPHYYRLLGIEVFEDDLQVIEAAADRQLSFLRKYQSGEYAAQCQKLLNEVSRARWCLLKAAAKADYDASLLWQLEPDDPVADISTINRRMRCRCLRSRGREVERDPIRERQQKMKS